MTKPRLNWSTIRESSLDFEAESEYHSIRNYCPCGRHFYDHFHAPRLASHLRHGKKWFVFPSPFIFLSHVVHVIKVDGKIISWIMIFKFNRESSIIILLRNSCFKKEYYISFFLYSYFIFLFQFIWVCTQLQSSFIEFGKGSYINNWFSISIQIFNNYFNFALFV